MSSPSLSDLGRSERSALDDRNNQQQRAGNNTTWISIHNAVISVFQRRDLGENELYVLNEGVRQLLKTELGSFFTEYLQNQLLTKGMVILRDKIRFYEGQKLLDSLAETWDFFFCDVLSTLLAIFYPVQGKEPSVRQLALLHFRNIITLNTKLDEALSRPRARIPASVIQMLLILQGVHEGKGVSSEYLKLESLVQKVVSPYLGTHGLFSSDGSITQSSCVLEKRLLRRWPRCSESPAKNLVVRSKSYNIPMLTPVAEYEPESGAGIRRHSVCQMTSFAEEFTEAPPSPPTDLNEDPESDRSRAGARPEWNRSGARPDGNQNEAASVPDKNRSGAGSEPDKNRSGAGSEPDQNWSSSSSPEAVVDQILESLDSDPEGIFIDFRRLRSSSSDFSRESAA
ncbi:proline-rich protein 5 isoform X2 [Pseudorasbora parva]